MVQFRPVAERGQYDPPVVMDLSAGMARDSQAQINAMQRNNAQLERIAQLQVEEANELPKVMYSSITLSQFSQTASKQLQRIQKQTAQDIEDGQTWATTFEGFENEEADVVEELASAAAEIELADTKKNSLALGVASGSPILQNFYYNQNAGIGKGLLNEKALLTQAKSSYAPWLTSFKSSNVVIPGLGPANQVFRSTDYAAQKAATDYGRYLFIKENGLQYATKRNFVDILNDTLYATEASFVNNQLSQNIAQVQKDNVTAAKANIVNEILSGGQSRDELQTAWNNGTEQLYLGNTNLTQTQANEEFMNAVVEAALIMGDERDLNS